MRIAYLGQMADVATENGISKKIRAQGLQWLQHGHTIRYFSLVPTTQAWSGLAPLEPVLIARGTSLQRLARSRALARHIREWQPDVIYFRYGYHAAGLPSLFRAIPTVAELNSDDLTEYPITLSLPKRIYHRLTRRRLLQAMAGFVPVTHELAQRFSSFNKPSEVVANGLDLASTSSLSPATISPIHLVFVGSAGTPWHGLERVGELARLCPEIAIDVVGCSLVDWNRVAGPLLAPSNFHFHGPLLRGDYAPLLQRATAAIGTMGLFRKQMHEACPLKVREYLAAGLPVIAGYQDTDIPAEADYFLRLPNNSASLAGERERIRAWLSRWQARRVPAHAIAHLDHSVKERQRLAFLHRFVRRGPAT